MPPVIHKEIRFIKFFVSKSSQRRFEVRRLDGGGLFELSLGFELSGNERSSLVGIFGSDISTDGTAFVEDESIIVLRRSGADSMANRIHRKC